MMWVADNATLIGLIFFFTIFSGIAVWAYMPANRDKIEKLKHIPLNEDRHE